MVSRSLATTVPLFYFYLSFLAIMATASPVRFAITDTSRAVARSEDHSAASSIHVVTPCTVPNDASTTRAERTLLHFDLQAGPQADGDSVFLTLNGYAFEVHATEDGGSTDLLVHAQDESGTSHPVKLALTTRLIPADGSQASDRARGSWHCQFMVAAVDGQEQLIQIDGFSVIVENASFRELLHLEADSKNRPLSYVDSTRPPSSADLVDPFSDAAALKSLDDPTQFVNEANKLLQLKIQAAELSREIQKKQDLINEYMREHRNNVPLTKALRECASLGCIAETMLQRVYDGVGITSESSTEFSVLLANSLKDQAVVLNESSPDASSVGSTEIGHKILQAHNTTMHEFNFLHAIDLTNPFAIAFQVVVVSLGVLTLMVVICNRCRSPRYHAERAADLEERQKTRAYRRAARRAAIRKQWTFILSTCFPCFYHTPDPSDTHDEKRALILQDAYLETLGDLDQAEKGEIMEAEIRQLRHAHEAVVRLVRRGVSSSHLSNDPPPSLVPLPYTARSRASTQTLPSYTSDLLPSYASCDDNTDSLVIQSSPRLLPTWGGSSSAEAMIEYHACYTPSSTIPAGSPRPSQETLHERHYLGYSID